MRPLILLTNDDGIAARGLLEAAQALLPLGELWIVAPERQWSGASRSMLRSVSGRITPYPLSLNGTPIPAFGVDATPTLAVIHATCEILPRRPDLVVSGINSGENVSTEITVSATVGAALEAAAQGIPALAVSLEMDKAYHYHAEGNLITDYQGARAYTYRCARWMLTQALPFDVDVLNVNIPAEATPATPWRLTRLSRVRYFTPTAPDRSQGQGNPGYTVLDAFDQVEPDSDIAALRRHRHVSITPISLDMTARVDFGLMEERLQALNQ